jgi:membrane protein
LGESLNTLLPFSFGWARVLTAVASLVSYTVLIAVLFKTIPNVQISWRDVAIGAVVTALLLSLGLVGLNLYFQFSNPTSSYGAASSFMALLIWIYYSAQMLFLGAEFTEVYALRFGNHFRPDEGAIWDSSEHLVQAE